MILWVYTFYEKEVRYCINGDFRSGRGLGKGAENSPFIAVDALNKLNVRGNFEYPDIDFYEEGINYTHIYTLFLDDENKLIGLTNYQREYANATLMSRFFHKSLFF